MISSDSDLLQSILLWLGLAHTLWEALLITCRLLGEVLQHHPGHYQLHFALSGLLNSPRTYCHGDLVVKHVNHQVQTDGLLPVYIRVSYRQLLAVPPPDLDQVALVRTELPDKEEEVIAVDASVGLKEEMANKQICPVGCVAGTRKSRILK